MVLKYILLIISFSCIVYAQNKCCNGARNIIGKGRCINNTTISGINCSKKYLLQSGTTENFTIDADGNLIEDEGVIISSDKYCLAKFTENGPDVALVCFSENHGVIGESSATFTLRAICALISVLFLVVTVIVYILVPDLRDLQGKCLLNSICCLAFAMLILAILQLEAKLPDMLCRVVGHVVFTLFLATFTWLNIISFHIWRTTVYPNMLGTNRQWYLIYCIYGYGVPLIIVLTAIIAHHAPGDHIKPRIGEQSCWFTGRDGTWAYFYGPIAFLLILNIIFFFWTIKTLWKDMKNCNDSPKLKSMKYKCLLYVKLFFIMGLSWSFEVISFAFQNKVDFLDYVWIVTDFINALQGVLIFLILVAFRKRALRGLAKRGLSCIPQQWKALEDEECDETLEEERLAKENAPEQTYKSKENQSIA